MIAIDKQKHFIYGGVIAFITALFLCVIFTPLMACLIGFLFSTLVGIGKELIFDKLLKKGNPEFMDAVFTSLGALLFTLILYLFL